MIEYFSYFPLLNCVFSSSFNFEGHSFLIFVFLCRLPLFSSFLWFLRLFVFIHLPLFSFSSFFFHSQSVNCRSFSWVECCTKFGGETTACVPWTWAKKQTLDSAFSLVAVHEWRHFRPLNRRRLAWSRRPTSHDINPLRLVTFGPVGEWRHCRPMRGRDPFFARPPPTAGRRWPSNRRESIGDGIPRNLADDWIERRRSRSLLTKQQPLVRLPSGRNGRQGRYSDWFSAAVSAIRFLLLFLAVFFSFYVGVFTFCFFFCGSIAALPLRGRPGRSRWKRRKAEQRIWFSFVFFCFYFGASRSHCGNTLERRWRRRRVWKAWRRHLLDSDEGRLRWSSNHQRDEPVLWKSNGFFLFFHLRNALIAPTILLVWCVVSRFYRVFCRRRRRCCCCSFSK